MGRDTRTDDQRATDERVEREFYARRRERGLPTLNHEATVEIGVRHVTDLEAERFHKLLVEAAYRIIADMNLQDYRVERVPHVSGSTYRTERSIYDEGAG